MALVQIVTDPVAGDIAATIRSGLEADGHSVVTREVEAYPVADGLTGVLHGALSKSDIVVIAVHPTTRNRAWVVAELSHSNLYPRVLLAVQSEGEVPSWAGAGRERVLVAGGKLALPA